MSRCICMKFFFLLVIMFVRFQARRTDGRTGPYLLADDVLLLLQLLLQHPHTRLHGANLRVNHYVFKGYSGCFQNGNGHPGSVLLLLLPLFCFFVCPFANGITQGCSTTQRVDALITKKNTAAQRLHVHVLSAVARFRRCLSSSSLAVLMRMWLSNLGTTTCSKCATFRR